MQLGRQSHYLVFRILSFRRYFSLRHGRFCRFLCVLCFAVVSLRVLPGWGLCTPTSNSSLPLFAVLKSCAFTSCSFALSLVSLVAKDLSRELQQKQYWWGNWETSTNATQDLWRLWTCRCQIWLLTRTLKTKMCDFNTFAYRVCQFQWCLTQNSYSLRHQNNHFRLQLDMINCGHCFLLTQLFHSVQLCAVQRHTKKSLTIYLQKKHSSATCLLSFPFLL